MSKGRRGFVFEEQITIGRAVIQLFVWDREEVRAIEPVGRVVLEGLLDFCSRRLRINVGGDLYDGRGVTAVTGEG